MILVRTYFDRDSADIVDNDMKKKSLLVCKLIEGLM